MSKTRKLTNRIGCLDLSPKYRKRPEKLVDVGVQVAFWSFLSRYRPKFLHYLKVVYFVESPLQVEIVSITALNLARMELELDLHLQQVSIPSQIPEIPKSQIPKSHPKYLTYQNQIDVIYCCRSEDGGRC